MDLIEQYREIHNNVKRFRGKLTFEDYSKIAELITSTGSESLLDYGCGKGFQYIEDRVHVNWGGITPYLYDPGYLPYSVKPTIKFDGVICTDVAEHIPEEDVTSFLEDVISYANKFVFFSIGTNTSRKKLLDGRSVHLTVKPREWWLDKIGSIEHSVIIETAFDDNNGDSVARERADC